MTLTLNVAYKTLFHQKHLTAHTESHSVPKYQDQGYDFV